MISNSFYIEEVNESFSMNYMDEMCHFCMVFLKDEHSMENTVKTWLPLFFGKPSSVTLSIPETFIKHCNTIGLDSISTIQLMYDIAKNKVPESTHPKPCLPIDIVSICKEFHKRTKQTISKSSVTKWVDAMRFVCDTTHSHRYRERLDGTYDCKETEQYLSCLFDSIMKYPINTEQISLWKSRLGIVTRQSWADFDDSEMDYSEPLQF
jgi:hypothetical protein